MNLLIKKLESNSLTDSERQSLVKILKEQKKTIEYYSQNFVGVWDDKANVNWRAKKCNELVQIELIRDKLGVNG